MKSITKAEFLDLWADSQLFDILVTPIAVLARTKPHKDYKSENVVVNI